MDELSATAKLIAAVAVETGISPVALMECDTEVFNEIVDLLVKRADEAKKAAIVLPWCSKSIK